MSGGFFNVGVAQDLAPLKLDPWRLKATGTASLDLDLWHCSTMFNSCPCLGHLDIKKPKKKARDAAASQSQRDASKVSSLSSLDVGTSPYQKKSLLNMFKPLQKQKPGRVVFSFNLQPLPTCWQCTCSSFFRIGPCSDRMYRINNLGLSSHQFWHLQHHQVKMVQHKPTNGPANCKTDLSVHMMDFRLVRDFASQLRLITD